MKNKKGDFACPRCGYSLVPVHAVEGSRRRVIALSCPEPYCDHMQLLPDRQKAFHEGVSEPQGLKTAANG